ncbi:MAG: hypothetical protein ABIF77_15995, partial [bacterium]
MKRFTLLVCLVLIAFATVALAAPANRGVRGYDVSRGDSGVLTHEDYTGFAKSDTDTMCMLSHIGSPEDDAYPPPPIEECPFGCNCDPVPNNTWHGDFQDNFGLPNWDCWYCVDYTQKDSPIWHVSTYQAANLDPLTVPNNAWWCGEDFASCGGGDPVGGYGNSYTEYLDYWAEVTSAGAPTSVTITAVLN